MLPEVIDLAGAYAVLSHPLTEHQLAERYRTATERGRRGCGPAPRAPERPISLLAAAVPVATNLDVAVHALHLLPSASVGVDLQLVRRIRDDSAVALHRCERALELDGRSLGYRPAEWQPIVIDIARAITAALRLDQEPPSIVTCAQDTVAWLAGAIADLDHHGPDAPAAVSETLGRLLALSLFADAAVSASEGHSEA